MTNLSLRMTEIGGVCCPFCQSPDVSYVEIDTATLQFFATSDSTEEHNIYFEDLRDYSCRNCDHQWLMTVLE